MPFLCPVCGYADLTERPRNDSTGGSFEICPSCGFQFGVSDDDRGITYKAWRQSWIDGGMVWDRGQSKPPEGWDPLDQLRNIESKTNSVAAFDRVAQQLRLASGNRGLPITLDTGLYSDLGLHGDDLWEFALWLHSEFGVEGPFYPNRYGPPEIHSRFIRPMLRKLFGLRPPQYESLTLRDVLLAIEAKRWV